jgi:hypothetical protein
MEKNNEFTRIGTFCERCRNVSCICKIGQNTSIIKATLFNEEENDLKALGIGKQLIREERNERFEETWLPKLQTKCSVKHDAQMGRYTFELNGFGLIDFYPKANKLLIRKLNKWKQPALKWLIAEFNLETDGSACV